jgi:pyruvate dehydrogenase E2 component (dihydrolipoamide acetyltransferase)
MSQVKQFRLPDPGEGLTEADVVSWKVKVGDTVAVNDVVVEIETAKSLVELPCPWAGVVTALLVAEGDTVAVGRPLISIDTAPALAPETGTVQAAEFAVAAELREDLVPFIPLGDGAVDPGPIAGAAPGGRTSVLVGYGPRTTEAKRRPRKTPPSHPPGDHAIHHQTSGDHAIHHGGPAAGSVLAKPPVRRLARDLGVDLASVTPSGAGGIVTREDVTAAATPTLVRGIRETRLPVRGVRKATAQAMVRSAFTAPHVTEFVTVDVTRTMRLVKRLKALPEFDGVRVNPLLLVAKAVLLAVGRHPGVNASWDEAAQEIVVKHYVNLGIAAATPRGLLVPNVAGADALSLRDLAVALDALVATAREGRTPPADLAGGTLTITNVGVFGVDTGTPILNPGEAAIVCLGAIRLMPWVHKGRVRPRQITTLGLSFDHRLVDGELGSRFLADIAALLEHPDTALLWT